MKIFIDTASVAELEQAVALGVADGVTTNPTLLARESGQAEEIYRQLCDVIDGPVCAEAVSLEADAIVEEGRKLAKISDQIVIKIPASREGLIAVGRLESEGIRTNLTLVFSAMQALLAA
ncbi:fructose-6-phosphate aldolase, partial [candidate division KSB1 bacterium]|nr:fructose-6-phosphate aldolase [candidate division KSB1 bacterium]